MAADDPQENFLSLQRIRSYYEFHDVDVDRYELDGERRVLMVSGREVSQIGIPAEARTWQNEHLVYTHGFGAVAAKVNGANTEGSPILELADIPVDRSAGPSSRSRASTSRRAVGDAPFVITNSGTPELDYEGARPATSTPVPEASRWATRAAGPVRVEVRRREPADLRSDHLDEPSDDVPRPGVAACPARPVPDLRRDPFLTIADGRFVWIWDAYTTTNDYPYSQSMNLAEATEADLPRDW